ncbi:MAG TPA: CpaD family pilus assembly lipoprotein [Azospirillum sp.]|nr:CpaD family pilus assembly lipoprotein [Azospirillum sp.]
MRTLIAPLMVLSVAALAACTPNAVDRPYDPVVLAPAAGNAERLVAVPPECGPTPTTVPTLRVNAWHNTPFGMGCSQSRNLGVSVEEPRDLLDGRRTGPPDAQREAAAVERWRKGEEKPIRPPGTGYTEPAGAK